MWFRISPSSYGRPPKKCFRLCSILPTKPSLILGKQRKGLTDNIKKQLGGWSPNVNPALHMSVKSQYFLKNLSKKSNSCNPEKKKKHRAYLSLYTPLCNLFKLVYLVKDQLFVPVTVVFQFLTKHYQRNTQKLDSDFSTYYHP